MKHYTNSNDTSELFDYEFKLPKYGKSTTDPTYYEPTATRIANMYKSSSDSANLYDTFDKDENPSIVFGRKPGITIEEAAQRETDLKNSISRKQNKAIEEALNDEKEINKMKNQIDKLAEMDAEQGSSVANDGVV